MRTFSPIRLSDNRTSAFSIALPPSSPVPTVRCASLLWPCFITPPMESFWARMQVELLKPADGPPASSWPPRLVGHCRTSQVGSVVAAQHRGIGAALGGPTVEFGDQVLAGDATFDHSAEAFAGVLVDDRDDLGRAPSVVESNWKSAAHTRLGASAVTVRRCGGGAAAFSASTLWYL